MGQIPFSKILPSRSKLQTYILTLVLLCVANSNGIDDIDDIECPIGFYKSEFGSTERPGCLQIKIQERADMKYHRCAGNAVPANFFESPNALAKSLGKEMFWTDYKRAYQDGPLINWRIGDEDMGKPLTDERVLKNMNKDTNSTDMCAAYSLASGKLSITSCSERLSRYCFVKTYSDADPVLWDCPSGYISFASPVPACLMALTGNATNARLAPLRVTWSQAEMFCERNSGSLPQRGYIYTDHAEFSAELQNNWELPMGIMRGQRDATVWRKPVSYQEKENMSYTEWNFDENASFDGKLNLVTLKNRKWQWTNSVHIFYYVICEAFVTLPVIRVSFSYESIPSGESILYFYLSDKGTSVSLSDIWCFTDSEKYYPTRVNVSKTDINKYKIDLKESGFYWCLSNNTNEFQFEESERILYVKSGVPENTYTLLLQYREGFYPNLTTDFHYVETLEKVLNDYLISAGKRHRRSAFNGTNENAISGLKLKRIYEKSKVLYHLQSREPLPEKFDDTFKEFRIDYARPAMSCREPKGEIGQATPPDRWCVYKFCDGDYNEGAHWIIKMDTICQNSKPAETTTEAFTKTTTPYYTTTTTLETTQTTDMPTTNNPADKVIDVANSLQTLSNSSSVAAPQLVEATNLINGILQLQESVSIPKTILMDLDTIVEKVKLPENENHLVVIESNIALVVAEKTAGSNIVGIMVNKVTDGFTENSIHLLTEENSRSMSTDNEIVVNIPSDLMRSSESRLSFVIFNNDRAFSHNNSQQRVNSRVLSISITNTTIFEHGQYIDIHLRPDQETAQNETKVCAFWDLEGSGKWSTEGCQLMTGIRSDGLETCRCNHLTHFAQIIRLGEAPISDVNEYILTVISFVGCAVSLLGLTLIGMTGVMFKSWRSDFSNKVWMHLSASVAVLIVTFLVISIVDFERSKPFACAFAGMALHYSVLSSFCWMFVSAVLSYKRLVRVFAKNSSHRLLKACAFGWLAPLLPIAILFAVDPDNYTEHFRMGHLQKSFCYPSGLGFWLTVFLPVALIVTSNTVLFMIIIYSVFINSKIKRHGDSKQLYRSITVSFLLFFLFGLTWVFGLLAENLVMAYLFCITATIQGLVLFVFFVLGNKKTRDLWGVKLGLKEKKSFHMTSSTSRSFASKGRSDRNVTLKKLDAPLATRPRSLSGNFDSIDSRFS